MHGLVAGGKRPKSALKPASNTPHAQPDAAREPKRERERERDKERDRGRARDRDRQREEDGGRDADDSYDAGFDSPMLQGIYIHYIMIYSSCKVYRYCIITYTPRFEIWFTPNMESRYTPISRLLLPPLQPELQILPMCGTCVDVSSVTLCRGPFADGPSTISIFAQSLP